MSESAERQVIVAVSESARGFGIRPGMTLTQARAILRKTDPFVYAIAIDSGSGADTRVNPEALRVEVVRRRPGTAGRGNGAGARGAADAHLPLAPQHGVLRHGPAGDVLLLSGARRSVRQRAASGRRRKLLSGVADN